MRTLNLTAAAFVVLTTSAAFAQQGPPRGPPQEALTACQGLSSGAACAFTHGPRNVTGTCRAGPNGEGFACAPSDRGPGGPSKGHHGPPPEALRACASSTAGASCSVSFEGKTLTGTCVAGPEGAALACLPPRP